MEIPTISYADPIRLYDYEVALRDVLKLRKNLKKEDWHSIGIHLSNRKRQGKESEVLWNSVPLAAKKVRKDVLRNRKINQLCCRSSELIPPLLFNHTCLLNKDDRNG